MNGVIGFSRLLETMPLAAETLETVRMIRVSGDILLKLINNVLDFSKVEAGKLELEVVPFDLRRSLEDTVALFGSRLPKRGCASVRTDGGSARICGGGRSQVTVGLCST